MCVKKCFCNLCQKSAIYAKNNILHLLFGSITMYNCENRGGIAVNDLKYTTDGYLIVSELYNCPLWKKSSIPGYSGCKHDCFFCEYADFRKPEYLLELSNKPSHEKLYSVCHNEANRK